MVKLFRPDTPPCAEAARWTIGVSVSSKCTQASAALVGAAGGERHLLMDVTRTAAAEIPKETTALFHAISTPAASGMVTHGMIAACRSQLADVQAALVNKLSATLALSSGRVLAVGVHDPGLWDTAHGEPAGYLGLCDASRLAEATGMNVIDAFPARDLALGGQGGPVTAVAEWMLLRSQLRHRVLLDLGRTIRLSCLPAASADRAESKILAFEVGPGTALLDLLARRLTGDEHLFDPAGGWPCRGAESRN